MDNWRAFSLPAYFAALLMVLLPLADLITNIWPVVPGNVQWRFGFMGLLAGFLLTPLFGLLLAIGVALAADHRGFLRILSLLNGAAAVLLSAGVVLFALDWLQIRPTLTPEAKTGIDVGSVKAMARHVLVALLLAWLAVVGVRASRRSSGSRRRAPAPLIREPDSPSS